MIDSLPPHNAQAEWMLLACATETPSILPSLAVDLFYLAETQAVFDVLTALQAEGRTICLHAVGLRLKLEVQSKFCQACADLPSPAGWTYWLDVCQEFLEARGSLRIAAQITTEAATVGHGGRIAVGSHAQKLQAIGKHSSGTKAQKLREIMPAVLDRLEAAFTDPESLYGVKTGFQSLDEMTLGFQPGQLWVIGARPAVGKSAIAASIANNVSASGVPVGFFLLRCQPTKSALASLRLSPALSLTRHAIED